MQDDLLLYQNNLYILPGLLCQELLQMYYDELQDGNFGYLYTLELLRRKYYWPCINQDVKK